MGIAIMLRQTLPMRDALMGMLDALTAILYGLGALIKWFSLMINAGIHDGLW